MKDYNLYLSMKDIEKYGSVLDFYVCVLYDEECFLINEISDFDNRGIARINMNILKVEGLEKLVQAIKVNILIGFNCLGSIDTINSLGLATCQR